MNRKRLGKCYIVDSYKKREKGLKFLDEFKEGDSNFPASVRWLNQWKKKYRVGQLNICSDCDKWKIFKWMFTHRLMQKDWLVIKSIIASSFFQTKFLAEKATNEIIIACSKAIVSLKIKLELIGKSNSHRVFKRVSKNQKRSQIFLRNVSVKLHRRRRNQNHALTP